MNLERQQMMELLETNNLDPNLVYSKKACTVRLDCMTRAKIRALSSMTNMTQQRLLELLITMGIKAAIDTYMDSLAPSGGVETDTVSTVSVSSSERS